MKRLFVTILIVVAVLVAALGLTIALGGPGKAPSPMSSIGDPFKNVDFSDLPKLTYFTTRDGTKLAFRAYSAAGDAVKGSVVLVHGSSASSSSMHLMAKGFAAAGYTADTLDIRGHGKSGTKGHIAYIGQLEDDMEDFVHSTKLAQPSKLAGFTSGGGFVLRFAGSPRQELFSNYLLLSPWISQDAATLRPGSGGSGYRGGSAHHRDRGVQRVWRARVRRPAGGQIRGQREGQRLTHAAIFLRPRTELQA